MDAAAADSSSTPVSSSASAKNLLTGLASRITGHSIKPDDKDKEQPKNRDKKKAKAQ